MWQHISVSSIANTLDNTYFSQMAFAWLEISSTFWSICVCEQQETSNSTRSLPWLAKHGIDNAQTVSQRKFTKDNKLIYTVDFKAAYWNISCKREIIWFWGGEEL